MSSNRTEDVVAEYLREVEARLAGLPLLQRRELLADLRTHVDTARAERGVESTAELIEVLERLGSPEVVAAAAYAEAGWPPGPDPAAGWSGPDPAAGWPGPDPAGAYRAPGPGPADHYGPAGGLGPAGRFGGHRGTAPAPAPGGNRRAAWIIVAVAVVLGIVSVVLCGSLMFLSRGDTGPAVQPAAPAGPR